MLGIYLNNFSAYIESLGVTGIMISAVCITFGLIISLSAKMYLTFFLIKREADLKMTEKENQLASHEKNIISSTRKSSAKEIMVR